MAAKERGLRWYDLGGIDPDENEGVYRFKARMGGFEVITAGPYDLDPRGPTGHITRITERTYRWVRLQAQVGVKRSRSAFARVTGAVVTRAATRSRGA